MGFLIMKLSHCLVLPPYHLEILSSAPCCDTYNLCSPLMWECQGEETKFYPVFVRTV